LNEFWKIFFGEAIVVFCWEFWQNEAEKRGVLVVNLWWMCGETWCFVTAFLCRENFPRNYRFILGDSRCGNWRIQSGVVRLSGSE
jgi:hypothetical protein